MCQSTTAAPHHARCSHAPATRSFAMRWLRTGSEDEMIARFVGGELTSDRFGPTIGDLLQSRGIDPQVVASPDLADARHRAQRREVLAEYRGYGTDAGQYLSG